jgi:hypothetical protein
LVRYRTSDSELTRALRFSQASYGEAGQGQQRHPGALEALADGFFMSPYLLDSPLSTLLQQMGIQIFPTAHAMR